MGRGNETFGKKEVRAKQAKRREEKEKKKQDRKKRDGNNLDDMIAYVDENGQITATPPDPSQKSVVTADEIEIGIPRGKKDQVHNGTVVFFNDTKGFGFIRDDNSKREIFVHSNELKDQVKENNRVIFEISRGPRGLIATNVQLDREPQA